MAFAAHRVRDSQDPIAILDAVRRAADRIDVFAQAGQVFEPRVTSDLFALLEPMIHPVRTPRDGLLFHPKVWIVEYADGTARSYRMLCASRNLTNDRSWDLVVRLDGTAVAEPVAQSAPLSALLRALPGMSVAPMPPSRAARIDALAGAVSHVEWERPAEVRRLRFHPFGIPGISTPPLRELFDGIRHGIISPFLSDEGIRRVVPPRSSALVVLSRREQLDRLSTDTLSRLSALILDDAANDDEADDEAGEASATPGLERGGALLGLHAKAYVLDRRSGSHVFIGSANATEAGFGGNVELLVEFEGPQTKFGVDALLGDTCALRALTVPYEPIGDIAPSTEEEADFRLEQAVRAFAARRYRCVVTQQQDGSADPESYDQRYGILVSSDEPTPSTLDLTARVNLITRPANTGEVPGASVHFEGLALTDLTPFLVIRMTDARGVTASTVVAATLEGDIPGRQDAVIARQLADRAAFMKLLALLLALDGGDGDFSFEAAGVGAVAWGEDGSGLFETLVKAVGVEHGGLEDVKRIVEHVRAAEAKRPVDSPPVLPEGFDKLWDAVWEAYARDGGHDG
ncbi:phospholipase D family protein [Mycolicibacterium sp.]|uniref:phospholipase D family protein n=1 Tax=Mycolicibacterium sp. TaxID=2320850 RepID=UPI0037C904CE